MKTKSRYLFLFLITVSCMNFSGYKLNERTMENFAAFTKLYGYIKYFHPSDEASKIDWEKFAIYGMKKVENAKNADELRGILLELFLPIAPTLIIQNNENIVFDKSAIIPQDTSGLKNVAWQHTGVFLATADGPYRSVRLNRQAQTSAGFGSISHFTNAKNYIGKKIKLRGAVKTDVSGSGNTGNLWLRVDRQDRKAGFFSNMNDNPITSSKWGEYEIIGDVAPDAESIYFGCFLNGKGRVWVDELRLYYMDNNEWKEIPLENSDFETGKDGDTPKEWGGNYGNYSIKLTSAEKFKGTKSLVIEYAEEKHNETEKLFEKIPLPGEIATKKLPGGLICAFPLALYSDAAGTIPHADKTLYKTLTENINIETASITDGNDKYLRLADIAIAWNIFRHFYPYFDVVDVNWENELAPSLEKAYNCNDAGEFSYVLKEFVAKLHDGHGYVWWTKETDNYYPPIKPDFVENKVVVSRILDKDITGLKEGDIIDEINGISVKDKMDELSKYISASTIQWKTLRLLNLLIRGENESVMRLGVINETGEKKEVILKRNFSSKQLNELGWYKEKRPDDIQELKKGIMYVNLGKAPMDKIDSSMNSLEKADGIIFDLRGYPNGNDEIICHIIDSDVQSAKWNVPEIIYPDGENLAGYDTSGRWIMEPKSPRLKGKIVFLTDGSAISYAESFMGIIEAYKLADIVGEPTAGTNGNVNPFILPGDYRVTWTGMKVLKHDGSQHHGIGILPTVPVSRTIQGVREGRDEILEKGIEIIEKNKY